MTYTTQQVDAAIKTHGTIWFDHNLSPVVPVPGQWFCEFEQVTPEYDAPPFIQDGRLVEYLGEVDLWINSGEMIRRHEVADDWDGEEARRTDCLFLVLQS
jgi:hypothetical protein